MNTITNYNEHAANKLKTRIKYVFSPSTKSWLVLIPKLFFHLCFGPYRQVLPLNDDVATDLWQFFSGN